MPCDYHLLPHAGIQSLSPYIPGKSTEEVALEHGLTDIIKLASNENPLGCSPLVTKAIHQTSSKKIATYPIAAIHPLRKKLAQNLGVDIDMLTLSNGSDALIPLLLNCFALHQDKHMLTHEYAFMMYAIQAQSLGIPVITTPICSNWEVDINAMIAATNEKTALIFLASPNNPTGVLLSQKNIKHLLENIPETTLLVVDEAYYEFVDKPHQLHMISLLAKHPNLIITRTFSKAYGMAGLRLGFCISNPSICALLHRVLLPFCVNMIALIAGEAALDDDDFIQKTLVMNAQGIKQLQQGFNHFGFNYLPTACNFLTIDCQKDSMPLFQNLQQHGIIVRPLHPYGLSHYLRVTVGTEEQNRRFLNTLEELHNDQ